MGRFVPQLMYMKFLIVCALTWKLIVAVIWNLHFFALAILLKLDLTKKMKPDLIFLLALTADICNP